MPNYLLGARGETNPSRPFGSLARGWLSESVFTPGRTACCQGLISGGSSVEQDSFLNQEMPSITCYTRCSRHAFPVSPSSSTGRAPSPGAVSGVHSTQVGQAHISPSDGGSPGYSTFCCLYMEASPGNHAALSAACHPEDACLCCCMSPEIGVSVPPWYDSTQV